MEKFNRRRFLKTGIAGAAGVAVLSTEFAEGKPSKQEKKIIYRTLGKTGIKVPVIGMGVMNANNPALIKAAMDKGITFYDTANGYQNGRNEEMLGEDLKIIPAIHLLYQLRLHLTGLIRIPEYQQVLQHQKIFLKSSIPALSV